MPLRKKGKKKKFLQPIPACWAHLCSLMEQATHSWRPRASDCHWIIEARPEHEHVSLHLSTRKYTTLPDSWFFFPLNIPISLVFFRHYPHFFSAFELCDSWGGGQIFWVFIKKVPLHDAIYKKYCNVIELLKYKIILIKFCFMLLRFGPTLFSDWIA